MFSENYSVCLKDDGSPREIKRNGPVVTYKAIGYDSGRVVAMQLIPLASIDEVDRVRLEERARLAQDFDHPNLAKIFDVGIKDDHFVFVSEYLEGETADEWIDEHGAMPADAVLRIGHQVMNALAATVPHGLTHRSIHPANLMILPGVADDGGWPRIKILNFGLAPVKLNSEKGDTREFVPSMPRQFASPEQLQNEDVRSDIFSLGAVMWFLLTGAAPPAAPASTPSPRLSAANGTVPRFVRNLVSAMLRSNPEERPQDPAVFAKKIHACLQKAERRTAFTRSFTPAAIPTVTRPEKKGVAPALALAAAIIALAALAAFFLPERFLHRESKPLGVLIGVPETTGEASPASVSESPATPVPVNQNNNTASLASPTNTAQPGSIAQQTASPSAPAATERPSSSQLAVNSHVATGPVAPAEGPSQTGQLPISMDVPSPAEKSEPPPSDVHDRAETPANDTLETATPANKPPKSSEHAIASKRDHSSASKTKSRRKRLAKSFARPLPPMRVGSESARFVGTTSGGRWVLQLPSGETVVTPPVPNSEDAPIVSPRRIRRVPRPIPLEDEPPVVVVPPGY